MKKPGLLLFLRVMVRGVLLFVGLCALVHWQMMEARPHVEVAEETFLQKLARRSGTAEPDVRAVLRELGPAIAAELERGNQVCLPSLGTFRKAPAPSDDVVSFQTIPCALKPATAASQLTSSR